MKKTWMLAAVTVVLIGGVACNRVPAQQAANPAETALDRAYRNGVLSQGEYLAKKAALAAPVPAPVTVPVAPAPPSAPAAAPIAPAPAPVVIPAPIHVAAAHPAKPLPSKAAAPAPAPAPAPVTTPATQPIPEPLAPAPVPVPAAAPAPVREEPATAAPAVCADNGIRPGKEKGLQERFFALPPDQVRTALLKALADMDFNIHRASATEIEASHKRHIGLIGKGGEKVTFYFEPATENGRRGTRVSGETKKNIVMRVGQKSWTNAVLEQAACTLKN